MFWSIKNSGEVLSKLKSRGFRVTSLSTYDFSTLYTTLHHSLIKELEFMFMKHYAPNRCEPSIEVIVKNGGLTGE